MAILKKKRNLKNLLIPLKLCIITGRYIVPTIRSNEVVPTSYVCAQKLCMYLPLKLCIITD